MRVASTVQMIEKTTEALKEYEFNIFVTVLEAHAETNGSLAGVY